MNTHTHTHAPSSREEQLPQSGPAGGTPAGTARPARSLSARTRGFPAWQHRGSGAKQETAALRRVPHTRETAEEERTSRTHRIHYPALPAGADDRWG